MHAVGTRRVNDATQRGCRHTAPQHTASAAAGDPPGFGQGPALTLAVASAPLPLAVL